jgi:hypothetical protein
MTRTRVRARAAAARQLRRTSRLLPQLAARLDITALHYDLTNLREQRTPQGATPHQHQIYPNHLQTNITTNTSTANKPTILEAIYHEDT